MLYRKDGTSFDTTEFKYYEVDKQNTGNKSKLFLCDDTLIKLYNIDARTVYRINISMFNLLKKLNDKNLVKLREYFYSVNSKLYKLFSIDAYTMDFIKKRDEKLINIERKEFLELIKSLDETLNRISEKGIIIEDMKPCHLIPTDNGITIIDPDMFHRTIIHSKDYVYDLNKTRILTALNALLYGEFDEDDYYKIEPVFFTNDRYLTLHQLIQQQLNEDTIRENQIQKKIRSYGKIKRTK